MNYHIMVQDKFIDSFIDDVYAIGEEAGNVFWLRGQKGDTDYIRTNKQVTYIGSNLNDIANRLQQLESTDNVFVHWYDNWIASVIHTLPNRLFVIFWGGEFFNEPLSYHLHWLFDAKTLDYEKKALNIKLIWRKNIFQVFQHLLRIRAFYRKGLHQAELKNKQIGRIDYLISSGINTFDINKAKEHFPALRAKHLPGFYSLNVDLSVNVTRKIRIPNRNIKLLLGNSATTSNNHLDAFEQLRNVPNIEVYCPLSYGDIPYRNKVIDAGRAIFGNNFFPIIDFMPSNEYATFLNDMDVVYMYHNRSQAFGNIVMAIAMGKPVFMKPSNSLKQSVEAMEIRVYDATQVQRISLEQIITEAFESKEANIQKVKNHLSTEKRLADWKKILQY